MVSGTGEILCRDKRGNRVGLLGIYVNNRNSGITRPLLLLTLIDSWPQMNRTYSLTRTTSIFCGGPVEEGLTCYCKEHTMNLYNNAEKRTEAHDEKICAQNDSYNIREDDDATQGRSEISKILIDSGINFNRYRREQRCCILFNLWFSCVHY